MVNNLILLATQATQKAAESSWSFEDFMYKVFGVLLYIWTFGMLYVFLFNPEAFGETKHPF